MKRDIRRGFKKNKTNFNDLGKFRNRWVFYENHRQIVQFYILVNIILIVTWYIILYCNFIVLHLKNSAVIFF